MRSPRSRPTTGNLRQHPRQCPFQSRRRRCPHRCGRTSPSPRAAPQPRHRRPSAQIIWRRSRLTAIGKRRCGEKHGQTKRPECSPTGCASTSACRGRSMRSTVITGYNSTFIEPTATSTSTYAIRDFQVQYWSGSQWTVVPGGSITGNQLVWRRFTFAPITTTAIRVVVTGGPALSRIGELEAYQASTVPPPPPTGRTNVAQTANGGQRLGIVDIQHELSRQLCRGRCSKVRVVDDNVGGCNTRCLSGLAAG